MTYYGAYASAYDLKRFLGGFNSSSADQDTALRFALEGASRWIESKANGRLFVSQKAQTVYRDGNGDQVLYLPPPYDFVSFTSIKVDADGDDTFEETLTASTHYRHTPHTPKAMGELRINTRDGTAPVSLWPKLWRAVEIIGVQGYSDDVVAAQALLDGALDDSQTTVTVDSGHEIGAGDVIRVDTEDMYVLATTATTATVIRGVNGSTAASHLDDATVYKRSYPGDIHLACLIEASRTWREGHTGFSGQMANAEFGGPGQSAQFPKIMDLISNYTVAVF